MTSARAPGNQDRAEEPPRLLEKDSCTHYITGLYSIAAENIRMPKYMVERKRLGFEDGLTFLPNLSYFTVGCYRSERQSSLFLSPGNTAISVKVA